MLLRSFIKRAAEEEAILLMVEDAKANPGGDSEVALYEQYLPMLYKIVDNVAFNRAIGKAKTVNLGTREDAVQWCFDSFRKALNFFDPKLGFAFSTALWNTVEQDLLNFVKNEHQNGALPTQEVEHPTAKDKDGEPVKFDIKREQESADRTLAEGEDGETIRMIDMMADDIRSRPDWQVTWDILVNRVEEELGKERNADTKKTIFRRLLEFGLNPSKEMLPEIQEEVGMSPSALCNVIGRNIQPAVLKVLKEMKTSGR